MSKQSTDKKRASTQDRSPVKSTFNMQGIEEMNLVTDKALASQNTSGKNTSGKRSMQMEYMNSIGETPIIGSPQIMSPPNVDAKAVTGI